MSRFNQRPKRTASEGTSSTTQGDVKYFGLSRFQFVALIAILLWIGSIKFGWGALGFFVACLLIIWHTLTDRKREKGELSAYSVFNNNGERLPGTLAMEEVEAHIRHLPTPKLNFTGVGRVESNPNDSAAATTTKRKIGRNDNCSCGSGKKFKHCCLNKKATPPPSDSDSD